MGHRGGGRPIDAARHIAELEEQGYSIVRNAVGTAFCDEVIEEIRRIEARGPPTTEQNEFVGYKTLRYFDLLNQRPIWQRVATQPDVLKIARAVLGEDMLLSLMGTTLLEPGETRQETHRDDGIYDLPMPHKHLVCNTMWALSDFTEENGATRIVKGTHKRKLEPKYGARYPSIAAVMPKGSICFILGTCYHGAGANTTNERRWALTVNYCAGCLRQHENMMLAVSRQRAATFSPELRALIGYRMGALTVGHIGGRDPGFLLDRDPRRIASKTSEK